ncbi:MAG TPA: glycine cleavage system protein GcvH [Trueperaceae bacterium]
MNIPKSLKYSQSHEWSKVEGDLLTVGITDFAQDQLGDVVFVELPEVGASFDQGDAAAVVESVKTASDINAPVAGEVTEVNSLLEDNPEKINEAPYGDGWLFRLRIRDEDELDALLDADAYRAFAEGEDA